MNPINPEGKPAHPKHPGIGSSTSLIRLESPGEPERGGFVVFFPSGRHLNVTWHVLRHIEPTKEAALQYTGRLVEELNKASAEAGQRGDAKAQAQAESDLATTNWTSVTAAVQRVILDFNQALSERISAKMALELPPVWPTKHKH